MTPWLSPFLNDNTELSLQIDNWIISYDGFEVWPAYNCYFQIMAPRPNFQEKWLSNDLFRSWLARVEGSPAKAYCRVCHKMLSAEITSLKRHRTSRQHIRLHYPNNASTSDGSGASCSTESDGGPNTSSQDGLRGTPTRNDDTSLSEEKGLSGVAYATILFAVFLAEHNLPFR